MKIPRKNSSGTGTAQRETPVQYPARLVYECQGNRRKERNDGVAEEASPDHFAQGTSLQMDCILSEAN
jgi:hypothetical protein